MIKKLFIASLGVYFGYQFWDSFNPESIKGKNVVITGASSGIGEQLAYHYARLGANIVITARRENLLKKVLQECQRYSEKNGKHSIALDMGQTNSSSDLIKFAIRKLGKIDILVLNHVTFNTDRQWLDSDLEIKTFYHSLEVSFFSYVTIASHAIPFLKKTSGSIVVVNSILGKLSSPSGAAYSTAKHALEGFFGTLRNHFHKNETNISITSCTLGTIDTEALSKNFQTANKDTTWLNRFLPMQTASDTALAILKAGVQRQERLYYPFLHMRLAIIASSIFPETTSAVLRWLW